MDGNGGLHKYENLIDPSLNFNVLGSTLITDPLDGREKLVLSNFASQSIGNVILIDCMTGEGESIQLPGDDGAWGILNLNNEKLLIGTCPNFGYLHSLDLKTRTWSAPLRDENEKYIWGLTLGSDGMVYGGTWPGCALLRYDPVKHELKNMGRVSQNPKDMYSRPIDGGVPGHIIIAGGYDTPFLKAWHIDSGTFRDFGNPGSRTVIKEITEEFICVEHEGELHFYHPSTLLPLEDHSLVHKLNDSEVSFEGGQRLRAHRLSDGRLAGFRGQDYFIQAKGEKPKLQRIPTPAPATHIHTLTSDADGTIWGASGFGQTIFSYKPDTQELWNSSNVCNAGGEVYGMCFARDRLFLSSYVGGDHMVYKPSEPWDQLNNINPQTLRSVSPALIRPTGRSVIGPDGAVWTGWSAKYGTYGGGLSRIDVDTLEVASWYDPIPEQQVAGLAADDEYLYFTTNGGASGLPFKECSCHFAVWSPEGKLVCQVEFAPGLRLEAVLAVGGYVFVRVSDEIRIFDPKLMEFIGAIQVGHACSWMIAVNNETVGAFCEHDLYFINVKTGSIDHMTKLPGHVGTACVTPDGEIYFASGTKLYKLSVL